MQAVTLSAAKGLAVETLKGNGHSEVLRPPLKVAL
jgi:hypothetical protein